MPSEFLFAPDDAPGGAPADDDAGDGTPEDQESEEGGGAGDLIPRTELQKANREAAKYRTRLREAEAKLKEIEDQEKTEIEKAQERVQALQSELETQRATSRNLQVAVLAAQVGIVPEARDDAARLLDWTNIQDPSDPREIEGALKTLVKDRPYLLGNIPGGADGGAGGGARPTSMNDLLRGATGRR